MHYYRAPDDSLHALEDTQFEYLLPDGSVEIDETEYEASIPAPVIVAPNISPRQIRMALTQMDLRDDVEAAVAAGDQDLKDWYQFSTYFERNHPQVIAMATALGVSSTDLDALWALGATL